MSYSADPSRYENPGFFRRCGGSGLVLPAVSLGCWQNFGGAGTDSQGHGDEAGFHENCREMLFAAFDLGITHFDLANNYGPPPGAAEERVGRILREDFGGYRDELIVSTKAGYTMWPGPYGDWGSRKYLLASLDASLKRLGLEYVDIFYSHRPDPNTPLEETMGALDSAVKAGKALYTGISNYKADRTQAAIMTCRQEGLVSPIIHQPRYSMFDRWVEGDLLSTAKNYGLGVICFSPLAQGLLTDKYLKEIPAKSRAGSANPFLKPGQITAEKLSMVQRLNGVAMGRNQSLAQLALSWVLRHGEVTSVLIGASTPAQIRENAAAGHATELSKEELAEIELILRTTTATT